MIAPLSFWVKLISFYFHTSWHAGDNNDAEMCMNQLNETMAPLMSKVEADDEMDKDDDNDNDDVSMEDLDLSKLNDQEKKQFCEWVTMLLTAFIK